MTETTDTNEPIIILHISDLHFGDEDPEKLEALNKKIAVVIKPDLICITGDIVNFPRKKYFLKAKGFLDSLKQRAAVYVIPGNHDAFFGGTNVKRFTKYLDTKAEFAEYKKVKRVDLCILGINSTFPSLRHLSNTGQVIKSRLERFRSQIKKLKGELGSDYKNAYKIVLLHHHPLPTIANKAETMVYLKKAGEFLNEMADQDINIILHGHQHDPCEFSINYNIGGANDSMIILSAGTALKRIQNETGISKETHYFVIQLVKDKVYVQSMNWHAEKKDFVPTRASYKEMPIDPAVRFELGYTYTIKSNGDLEAQGDALYKAKSGREISDFTVAFGVDAETVAPVTNLTILRLAIQRAGSPVNSKDITLRKDLPHEKIFKVQLDPPITVLDERITWSYFWPGACKNLIVRLLDRGEFFMDRRTDKFKVIFKNQHPNYQFGELEVIYQVQDQVKYLGASMSNEIGFEIANPRKYYTISYRINLIPV